MCRMVAFAGNIENAESDIFRLQCLKHDANCLKNQSIRCRSSFGRNVFTIKDLLGIICKPGNPDGWGISSYLKDSCKPRRVRSNKPAFNDLSFDKASEEMINAKPSIVMAHIRLASRECCDISAENVHPFVFDNWSFMHNGFMSGALSDEIQNILNNSYFQILGKKPAGSTDSESSFYYFLGKLKERFGTTDSSSLKKEDIKAVFAESINDLVSMSQWNYHSLNESMLEISGEVNVSPSCNFIVSEGRFLMAFCKGPKLYLGIKTYSNGSKEFVVSSEVICMHDDSLKWLDLPENHILFLDKEQGFIPEFTYLDKALLSFHDNSQLKTD